MGEPGRCPAPPNRCKLRLVGRSAEDDRDVLALPLQRPRRHLPGGRTPDRVHPPSFDPEAARKAWRQVARVRGGGPGLGVDPGQRRPPVAALLGVLLATAVVWGLWSMAEPPRDTPPPVEVAAAAATTTDGLVPDTAPAKPLAASAAVTPRPIRTGEVPMPASSIGTFTPKTAGRMAPPATEDQTQIAAPKAKRGSAWSSAIPMPAAEPTPRPATPAVVAEANGTWTGPRQPEAGGPRAAPPLVQRGAVAPPGSPSAGVAALRKLPKSDRDRPPLRGVGVSGIHLDRLDLGSAYDDGVCQGSNRSYAASATKAVHVCFRAVHRRQTERVLVKWSKNGRLVRRAWVVIPAAHAYRTRAGLRLRDSHVGSWTVTVESSDGIVLASDGFKVTP